MSRKKSKLYTVYNITGDNTDINTLKNQVGWGVAPSVLSHHPAYGSRTKAVPKVKISEFVQFRKHRHKTKFIKEFLSEGVIHMRRPRIPPGSSSVKGWHNGSFFRKTCLYQPLSACPQSLPLLSHYQAKSSSYPSVDLFRKALYFRHTKVVCPPSDDRIQVFSDKPLEISTLSSSKNGLEICLQSLDWFLGNSYYRLFMPCKWVSQKLSLMRLGYCTFLFVNLEPESFLHKLR